MNASPEAFTLHEIGAAEIDAVATLESRCFSDPWNGTDLSLYLGSGAVAGWLLVTPSGPAAFALFQLLPGETELLRIGVSPERRRQGLAGALLNAALARLAADGRPVCHLEVRAGNRAARALYGRLGFEVVGHGRAYYGDGEDAVRYRRERPPNFG